MFNNFYFWEEKLKENAGSPGASSLSVFDMLILRHYYNGADFLLCDVFSKRLG